MTAGEARVKSAVAKLQHVALEYRALAELENKGAAKARQRAAILSQAALTVEKALDTLKDIVFPTPTSSQHPGSPTSEG